MSHPYVSRIEIENFRNLHGLTADLAPSAVVVGENRSGKSNLLHALRLILDSSLPDSQRILRAEDFWDGLSAPFEGAQIAIRIFIAGFEGDGDAEAALCDCVVGATPATAKLTYLFRPRSGIGAPTAKQAESDYEYVIFGGDDESVQVGAKVRRWLSFTVLPAMRDAEDQLQSNRRTLLRPLIERVRPAVSESTLDDARTLLNEAASKLLVEKPLQDLQERINERLRQMVGAHHGVSTKFDFAGSDPHQLLRSLRLFLDEGQTRSMADASLGTANLVFLCLLIQDLDERVAEKQAVGTILAIEEPEAHLHPHVQRLLFRYALRRIHSVLVTTHSPHVASVAPLPALLVLRTTADHVGRLHGIANVQLDAGEVADLERYLDVTRAEMLFSRGVIFVEGRAEQYLVPAFARFEMERLGLGSSLDDLGISVCGVAGTDFRPYWKVTSDVGWGIPRVVVTDGDPKATKAGLTIANGLLRGARLITSGEAERAASVADDGAARATLEPEGVFVGERTLELDLLASLSGEMKLAYGELSTSTMGGRFSAAVDKAVAGDADASGEVLSRIEQLGKGRFAQRLASKVGPTHAPPPHIARALKHLFTLVPHA